MLQVKSLFFRNKQNQKQTFVRVYQKKRERFYL